MYDLNPSDTYSLNADVADFDKRIRYWSLATVITPPGECWSILASFEKPLNREAITYSLSMEFKFGE
jgi:hypothetical protein